MSCCGYRREDAEDVVQDVYLGVLDNGLRFNGQSSLRTWLFGVIRHKARARLRRDRLRALLGVTHTARIDTPAPPPSPDDHTITSERRETMRRAIGEFATRQREVLLLVFYHDLTIEEAAWGLMAKIKNTLTPVQQAKLRELRERGGRRD